MAELRPIQAHWGSVRKSTTFRETRYPSLDLAKRLFWHFLDSIERFLGNKENEKAKILILLLSFALTTVGPTNLDETELKKKPFITTLLLLLTQSK